MTHRIMGTLLPWSYILLQMAIRGKLLCHRSWDKDWNVMVDSRINLKTGRVAGPETEKIEPQRIESKMVIRRKKNPLEQKYINK